MTRVLRSASVLLLMILLLGCSQSGSDKVKRARRTTSDSSTSSVNTLPPQSSTTIQQGLSQPLLSAEQISQQWDQSRLCGLIDKTNAQKILKTTTIPDAKYTFSPNSGARCAYANSSGDEISVEISVNSYSRARAIDLALNYETIAITVAGVIGVSQSNKSTGVVYNLNIWGSESNQWSISAPRESQAKDVADIVVGALI